VTSIAPLLALPLDASQRAQTGVPSSPSSGFDPGSTSSFAGVLAQLRAPEVKAAATKGTTMKGAQGFRLPGLKVHAVARPSVLHAPTATLRAARPGTTAAPGTTALPGTQPKFIPLPASAFGRTPPRALPTTSPATGPPAGRSPSTPAVHGAASAPAELARTIRRTAALAGVAPELSVAVARAESNLDQRARSSDGLSFGTFQMTRATAAEMRRRISAGTVARPPGSDDVALGVGYLRYLQNLFTRGGKLGGALKAQPVSDAGERQLFTVAAYNAGEGRVARAQARARAAGADPTRFAAVRRYLPSTTQAYVQRVSAFAAAGEPPIVA